MKQEIKIGYSKEINAITIQWLVYEHPDKVAVFTVRMPTDRRYYYVPFGIDVHSSVKQYDAIDDAECNLLKCGRCYVSGLVTAGKDLWSAYTKDGDEEVIWAELKRFLALYK